MPASNHCSRRDLRLLRGKRRMPKRTSPRITGSTAISRSFFLSHSTTRTFGNGLVGSLRTFASIRYFTAYRSIPTRSERRTPSRDRREASRRDLHLAVAFFVGADSL